MRTTLLCLAGALLIAGCNDNMTGTRDTTPAAPRGVASVTGDHEAILSWLSNTERDVVGYRVYVADCADCEYHLVGQTTTTSYIVSGLQNGVTRYFAVSAYDHGGNESDLSYETIFDTPRPEGTGLTLASVDADSMRAGYDFSDNAIVPYSSQNADVVFGASNGQLVLLAPFTDTDIQDAGYATTLDAVDFAPQNGWSPTGTVELILGHCYIVRTPDAQGEHYAKLRVTALSSTQVVLDWAYQVAPGNRELHQQPSTRPARVRRPTLAAAGT